MLYSIVKACLRAASETARSNTALLSASVCVCVCRDQGLQNTPRLHASAQRQN